MDLIELRARLDALAESLTNEDRQLLNARLQGLASAFPFNNYEFILMFMLDKAVITFEQYEQLRQEYVSSNLYLELFELAPRIFGEIWGQKHISDLDARFIRPSKEVDVSFAGEYDLWLNGRHIEVKAARAINTRKRGSLISKALAFSSAEPF